MTKLIDYVNEISYSEYQKDFKDLTIEEKKEVDKIVRETISNL